jgi:hypothetical protein
MFKVLEGGSRSSWDCVKICGQTRSCHVKDEAVMEVDRHNVVGWHTNSK